MAVDAKQMCIGAAVAAAIAALTLWIAPAYGAPSDSVLEVGDTCGTGHSISSKNVESNDSNEGEAS